MKRSSKIILNFSLALASVLLTYLAFELLLFKPLLPYLPPSLYNHMVREARVLGQTTKPGLLPSPGYIAIAGDSYAQGKGDWFTSTGYDRTAKYQSTHVIHDLLGVDVLTFGRSGAGSVEANVLEPIQSYRLLNENGLPLAKPGCMFFYFYEGNDIENNRRFLGDWFKSYYDMERLHEPGVFQKFLGEMVAEYANGSAREPGERIFFGNFLFRLFRDNVLWRFSRRFMDEDKEAKQGGKVNRIVVNNETFGIPDRLQSPCMTDNAVEQGLFVYQQSVLFAADFFKDTTIYLVYVPSPIACYEVASDRVSVFYGDPEKDYLYPREAMFRRSDEMAASIRDFAREKGFGFVDARPYLRKAAETEFIHGPTDWAHFNKKGYEVLAGAMIDALRETPCPGLGAAAKQ